MSSLVPTLPFLICTIHNYNDGLSVANSAADQSQLPGLLLQDQESYTGK